MSVRLVHPPRASAGDTSVGMPTAANDDYMGNASLWFPSTARDYLVVSALILLLLAAVLLTLYGAEPRDSWFALWGIAK
ncbi:hypothetical protein FHT32_004782 [Variovorax sp. SG517]|uniref:hypothetical protein n=1 Tax=Variovorax sp. SG517 TaxID=2587117 RepID=UPI00159D30C9|nr:hypothetical protein [Variovorax sp. SG517]NVM91118.1 hypothetical protein [Variovorax sp. SG517]